jgi:2-polyprenyl-6-methoxyphenol hydroxylase-like FAD-dependent oxidoreductase
MRIAIVGCGIAGMTAALALSRRGHAPEIFERFDEPRPTGAGLLLQPSGLAALRALGLEGAVRGWGAEVKRLDGRTRNGHVVLDLRYRGETGLGIHRGALFTTLHDAVVAAGIAVRGGLAIEAIDGAEREHALLSDAAGGRHDGFDLVVVADGAHSSLRANVAPRARAPLYRWGALWATLPDPEGRWAGELRQVYDGARLMIGILPVGRAPGEPEGAQGVAFFWSLKSNDFSAARARGLDALKRQVAALWPDAGALIAPLATFDALTVASYRNVAARPWTRGRLVVIGDAAHGTSPQLGQGANLAMIDALALAEAVGDREENRPVLESLAAYRRARSSHTAYYQFMSWALTPLFQGDGGFLPLARNLTMGALCRLPLAGAAIHATLSGRATFGLKPWRGSWETPALPDPRKPTSAPTAEPAP